ncbi:MAG: hypothetical protein HC836_16905 [Richelia sp. RM2_1_2]|nr:hypothetical protein [Richelia sp. RM2_1_2]
MRIEELVNPEDVKLTFNYHKHLNPAIWQGKSLRSEVEKKLETIANMFVEFLEIPELDIVDVIITGSNANYNWTGYSDLDLHIVVDMDKFQSQCSMLVGQYFQAKKKIWNDTHDIQIRGFNVELYVQDSEEEHTSSGVYSLMNSTWNVMPEYAKPSIDSAAVKIKAADIMNQIDEIEDEGCIDIESIDKLKEKIRLMRKSGLERAGEFSVENLAFKTLRNNGYLEKLHDCSTIAMDKKLSLLDGKIYENRKLTELFGFGKKDKVSTSVMPTKTTVTTNVNKPNMPQDPLQQQWNLVRDKVNSILKDANPNNPEIKQFVSDMKDFAQAIDKAFSYINDPKTFRYTAKIAAQRYVNINQKYFSKTNSTRGDGAASKLDLQGQSVYTSINRELLPFFKALNKRII